MVQNPQTSVRPHAQRQTTTRAITNSLGTSARRLLALGLLLCIALVVASCGGNDAEEDSTEELLEQLEGRDLSPAEVAEREEVAALLCGLDNAVLIEIWAQLDATELAFQDIVFSRTCPERLSLYAAETGRFATGGSTDNAEDPAGSATTEGPGSDDTSDRTDG